MKDIEKLEEFNNKLRIKDLRKLSEEEFLAFANELKIITNNFSEFSAIIKQKSQVLLLLRCLAGMERKEFAERIEIHEEILRQIEVGKREIRKKGKLENINKNLKEIFSSTAETNLERAKELFKKVAIVNENEEIEKIRKELSEMGLPNDLRKMNEEQFLKLVEWLREKTDNFRVFPKEVFIAKSQLIIILRCILGMSRPTFARKIGIFQETLRHVEANRKGSIFSTKMAEEWCRKINEFLKSGECIQNIEKALVLWKEINLHQLDGNEEEIEKIRNGMERLGLLDWNRKDSELLPQFFNFFREKTNNFTSLPLSLFLADSSLSIFFIRCCTGMKQKELARHMECTKDLVRHLENKHERIIHVGPALRWIDKLQRLLPKEIDFETFERNWKKIIFAKTEERIKRESFRNLPAEEIVRKIEELRKKTNNFTNIEEALEEDGRIVFLFRVMCRMRIKELARILDVDRTLIRDWEDGERRINPATVERIAKILREIVRNVELDREKLIKNLKDIN